jgi:hypothetical protein
VTPHHSDHELERGRAKPAWRHIFQQPAPHEELTQTYSNLTRAEVVGHAWYGVVLIVGYRRLPALTEADRLLSALFDAVSMWANGD